METAIDGHVAYLKKSEPNKPIYVSDRGDIMVDFNGSAAIAASREVRLNVEPAYMSALWDLRTTRKKPVKVAEMLGDERSTWRLV